MFARQLTRSTRAAARTYATVSEASGVKVAGIDNGQPTTTISVVVKAGSRYETRPGVAHALKNFAFKVSCCGGVGVGWVDGVERSGVGIGSWVGLLQRGRDDGRRTGWMETTWENSRIHRCRLDGLLAEENGRQRSAFRFFRTTSIGERLRSQSAPEDTTS